MLTYDCFTFWSESELDLLELRMKLLNDVVDFFCISEANHVHSGAEKPYVFEKHWDRFEPFKNKIIYLPVELSIEGLQFNKVDRYSENDGSWILEKSQRQALWYIKDMIDDESLILVGDLDELVSPLILEQKEQLSLMLSKTDAFVLTMDFSYYFMNCKVETGPDVAWNGTVITTGKYFKNVGPQYLRDNRNNFNRIPRGGYHCSFLNGKEAIKTKIESFAHTEFNRPDITSEQNITEAMENGKDVFNRPGVSYKFHPVSDYPEYLQKLMLEYPQFIKQI